MKLSFMKDKPDRVLYVFSSGSRAVKVRSSRDHIQCDRGKGLNKKL